MKGKIRERLILGNLSTDKLRKKNAIFFPNQALPKMAKWRGI
jgi:hypothetical protein